MSPDIQAVAVQLGVEARALAAVVAVEAGDPARGLVDGGHPLIRVEAHLVWRYATEAQRPAVDARFRVGGPKPWEGHLLDGQPYHGHQDRERAAYAVAVQLIGDDGAARATSWGCGQVLGDWHGLGFPSVAAFEAAQTSEAGQIDTMARYIQARPVLLSALRAKDWGTVARSYNGAGKVADYSTRLARAYAAG